ncbi:MAG TPA: DciA family protein [Vicinamibacterales bacterium]|nr:DciA family protein [Vicinamibacterales bacterium]HOQ60623.1 DciA family protein [Vicinamibacterales bacterium]HPK71331.1 DciA family protein [Vicinamibacterales bacterium]HPW21466.1 DciA family protein [Vicinamibacterales bacterium]
MEPVQSLAAATIARVVRPAPLSGEKILFAWRLAVGPALARVTRIRLLRSGILDVRLDDERFGEELARSADTVLRRVQEVLGREVVRRVAVQLRAPDERRPRRRGASGRTRAEGGR